MSDAHSMRIDLNNMGIDNMAKRTKELEDEIIERISCGEPLRAICRDEHMPSWVAIYDWVNRDESFALRIARARELGFDAIALEALEIADTPLLGVEEEESDNGYKIKKSDMLGHRKLQVETRLKLLAKWCPKRYGDRQAVELTGADGGPVEITETERVAQIQGYLELAKQRAEQRALEHSADGLL